MVATTIIIGLYTHCRCTVHASTWWNMLYLECVHHVHIYVVQYCNMYVCMCPFTFGNLLSPVRTCLRLMWSLISEDSSCIIEVIRMTSIVHHETLHARAWRLGRSMTMASPCHYLWHMIKKNLKLHANYPYANFWSYNFFFVSLLFWHNPSCVWLNSAN